VRVDSFFTKSTPVLIEKSKASGHYSNIGKSEFLWIHSEPERFKIQIFRIIIQKTAADNRGRRVSR